MHTRFAELPVVLPISPASLTSPGDQGRCTHTEWRLTHQFVDGANWFGLPRALEDEYR